MTDFEEYIRQGEPDKQAKAYAWQTAIGLQAVDGLTTSDYLKDTARKHIEGEISIDEARNLIKAYYQSKENREPDDDGKQEADKVSANIAKILSEQSFSFNVAGFLAIHRHIFDGVFKHAGQLRQYDITKKEWVLRGDTVLYGRWQDLRMALEQEKQFDYRGLDIIHVIEHLAKFVSGIWQIHPFAEGNTRTTAVFFIKYLRSIGFNINNDLFMKYSWYFRNALVRANYRNIQKNIAYDSSFLVRFLRNLLLDEKNELRNRSMLINPPQGWTDTPASTPASSISESPSENVRKLLLCIGEAQLSIKEILVRIGLKDRMTFMKYTLTPAMNEGLVVPLYPDKPRHPRQKYRLTVKGSMLYSQIKPS